MIAKMYRESLNSNHDLVDEINRTSVFKETKGAKPVSMDEILAFSDVDDSQRYEQFTIPKRKNKGVRAINAPCKRLKFILRCINEILSSRYTPPFYVTGFVKGRSVLNNASIHYGQKYVYSLDLKDFFDNISCSHVVPKMASMPLGISEEVATTMTLLSSVFSVKKGNVSLAQGSPISPVLANIACTDLDQALFNRSLKDGVKYSRYADDLTFSTSVFDFASMMDFLPEVKCLIQENGFIVNESKERERKSSQRQEVTGVVVNSKPNVARDYYRELRDLLYIWEEHGLTSVLSSFAHHRKMKFLSSGKFLKIMKGRIEYLGMIRGKGDSHYIRLNDTFIRLAETAREDKSYVYRDGKSSYNSGSYAKGFRSDSKWTVAKIRHFTARFLKKVVKYEIIASEYGELLKIWKKDGKCFCMPVSDYSKHGMFGCTSLNDAKIFYLTNQYGDRIRKVAWGRTSIPERFQ